MYPALFRLFPLSCLLRDLLNSPETFPTDTSSVFCCWSHWRLCLMARTPATEQKSKKARLETLLMSEPPVIVMGPSPVHQCGISRYSNPRRPRPNCRAAAASRVDVALVSENCPDTTARPAQASNNLEAKLTKLNIKLLIPPLPCCPLPWL